MFNENDVVGISVKNNILRMLFFGVVSALAAFITFSIPGIEGGVSDPREIIALVGIVFLSHGIYAVGLGFLAALGGPYDNLLTTIFMHITAIPLAWLFLNIVKKRIKNLPVFGSVWFVFVLVLYVFVFSSSFVLSELLFGHIEFSNVVHVFIAFVSGVKFEAILTAIITALAVTMILILRREKENFFNTFEALQESEKRFKNMAEQLPVAVFETNLDMQVTYFNSKSLESFGYSPAEVLGGLSGLELFVPEDRERLKQNIARRMQGEVSNVNEYRALRKDGSIFSAIAYSNKMIEDGKVTGVRGFFVDITARKQAEEEQFLSMTQTAKQLEYQAHHHPLTGLPNRLLLYARLEHSIQHVKREGESGAVMFLDLDNFKKINDSLGHFAGDTVLKEVALRLQKNTREVDTVAHMSGDEFIVVLQSIQSIEDAKLRAQQILDDLQKPFMFSENELYLTGSIGIAEFSGDIIDIENLLKNADIAMYKSKRNGRNCYQIYSPDFTNVAIEK